MAIVGYFSTIIILIFVNVNMMVNIFRTSQDNWQFFLYLAFSSFLISLLSKELWDT